MESGHLQQVEHDVKTTTTLPKPVGMQTFTVDGRTFEVWRFKDKTLNFDRACSMAFSVKAVLKKLGLQKDVRMLSVDDAEEICGNDVLSRAFGNALRPKEWSYVFNPEAKSGDRTAGAVYREKGKSPSISYRTCHDEKGAPALVLERIAPGNATEPDIEALIRKL